MKKLHHAWRKTPAIIRKPGVFIVGWIIVLGGIVLLPLPGPGWAIIFIGFAILATEFASAKRTHDFLVSVLRAIVNWLRRILDHMTKKKVK
jgi:uncharacterized protein (TIGR02611 family)